MCTFCYFIVSSHFQLAFNIANSLWRIYLSDDYVLIKNHKEFNFLSCNASPYSSSFTFPLACHLTWPCAVAVHRWKMQKKQAEKTWNTLVLSHHDNSQNCAFRWRPLSVIDVWLKSHFLQLKVEIYQSLWRRIQEFM